MKKTLVTGISGFIGSRLFKKVGDFGIDRKLGNDLLTMPEFPEGVDLVYHLAASTSVEESWSKQEMYMLDLVALARLVKAYPDARIIYAQSAASIEASSPYGFSKWACGEYLKRFHKNHVICTFPNVYGGGQGVVDMFKGKSEVIIYGDGKQVRDFVHVDDIVEGLLLAKDWPAGEYSMGSGKGTTVNELAEGKRVVMAKERKEIRESILPNTTPDWSAKIDVMEYMR